MANLKTVTNTIWVRLFFSSTGRRIPFAIDAQVRFDFRRGSSRAPSSFRSGAFHDSYKIYSSHRDWHNFSLYETFTNDAKFNIANRVVRWSREIPGDKRPKLVLAVEEFLACYSITHSSHNCLVPDVVQFFQLCWHR